MSSKLFQSTRAGSLIGSESSSSSSTCKLSAPTAATLLSWVVEARVDGRRRWMFSQPPISISNYSIIIIIAVVVCCGGQITRQKCVPGCVLVVVVVLVGPVGSPEFTALFGRDGVGIGVDLWKYSLL